MKWMVIVLYVFAWPAWAQDSKLSEKLASALDAVQEELTDCAAYFQFAKTCAPNFAKQDELQQIDKIINHFDELAFVTGSKIGMTQDAMLARLKLALETQNKLTEGKCVNFASLLTRYADRCKILGENPEAIVREYMAK